MSDDGVCRSSATLWRAGIDCLDRRGRAVCCRRGQPESVASAEDRGRDVRSRGSQACPRSTDVRQSVAAGSAALSATHRQVPFDRDGVRARQRPLRHGGPRVPNGSGQPVGAACVARCQGAGLRDRQGGEVRVSQGFRGVLAGEATRTGCCAAGEHQTRFESERVCSRQRTWYRRGDPQRAVHLQYTRAAGWQMELAALFRRCIAGQQWWPAAGPGWQSHRRGADEVARREPQLRAADTEVLDAPGKRAGIDQRVPYAFDLFDTTITGTFKAEFALPLSPADFYATYLKLKEAYEDSQLKALLAKEPDRVFPRGTGSNRVLFGTARLDSFPAFLTRNSAGDWAPMVQKGPRIALPDNGYVAGGYVPGSYGGINLLFHLREPDTATGSAFYQNPGQTMDMLLKLGFMSREIARQKIRVTSLGNPALNTTFTENWQR